MSRQPDTHWHIRRTECGKELRSDDVAKNFKNYEAARERLKKIAASFGTQITKDSRGLEIICLTEGKDAVLYWIYGESQTLTNHRPQIGV